MDGKDFREFLTLLPKYTALNACTMLGFQTGLFNTLCEEKEPISVEDLAVKCEVKERLLVEWVEILSGAKVLSIDDKTNRYFLRDEIKEVFKEPETAEAHFLSGITLSMGARQKKYTEFFKQDGPSGLPIAETPEAFDILNANPVTTYQRAFEDNFFKHVAGLRDRLEAGTDVVDVGCGCGGLIRVLAENFPEGRYTGVDSIESLVVGANKELVASGLTNCSFEKQNAESFPEEWREKFDVVILHDVFHDLSHPKETANELFRIVKGSGVVLLLDFNLDPDSKTACKYSSVFTTIGMYYCIPGDMRGDGAFPTGLVRTGDAIYQILKSVFPSVEFIRVSDTSVLHICSK